ncbi:hypothetical protein T11_606 [Trichinella zimbabwensis]|uniref:Uncharacterized protein n=1 Tax=Trichinella zimbabwensis TaxID=268475 RepID=A0A0V1GVM5_9BILA|nr:hypothetical protein T11_606 [Trichinella zimbabwensis]
MAEKLKISHQSNKRQMSVIPLQRQLKMDYCINNAVIQWILVVAILFMQSILLHRLQGLQGRTNFTINHRIGCYKLSEIATFASASQKPHGAAALTGDLAENLSENSAMPPALAPTQMLIIMQ